MTFSCVSERGYLYLEYTKRALPQAPRKANTKETVKTEKTN